MLNRVTCIFMILGNIGNAIIFINIFLLYHINNKLFNFFRGGNLGGILIGVLSLIGIIGCVLFVISFLVSVFNKRKTKIVLANAILFIVWIFCIVLISQYL